MKLENLREQIDEVDWRILKLVKKRMNIVQKIGEFKRLNNLPVIDTAREKQLSENRVKWGKSLKLHKKIVAHLFSFLIKEARRIQTYEPK